jgi:hypothetical protein
VNKIQRRQPVGNKLNDAATGPADLVRWVVARHWLLGTGRHCAGGLVAARRWGLGCGRAAQHWGLGGGTALGAWWRRGAAVGAGRRGRAVGRTGDWPAGSRGRVVGQQLAGRSRLRRWAGCSHVSCRPAGGSNPSHWLARAEGGESSESQGVRHRAEGGAATRDVDMLATWARLAGWVRGVWFFPNLGVGHSPPDRPCNSAPTGGDSRNLGQGKKLELESKKNEIQAERTWSRANPR